MKRIDKSKIYIRKRDLEVCIVIRAGKKIHYVTYPMLREIKTTPEVFASGFRPAEDGEISKDRAQALLQKVPKVDKQDEFLDDFQTTLGLWCKDMFGDKCARDPQERGLRLLEEALEAAQAVNVSRQNAHKLVDYVFGRPTGELSQEISGVLVTVLALADAAGISAERSLIDEINRIHEPSFREKIRAKHNTKELAGVSIHPVDPE